MEILFIIFIAIFFVFSIAVRKIRAQWSDNEPDIPMEELSSQAENFEVIKEEKSKKYMTPPPFCEKADKENNETEQVKINPLQKEFDLEKAVIYSEILKPKWKEY